MDSEHQQRVAPPLQISDRIRSIPEAASIYINQLAADLIKNGEDVLTLSLGEANFDVPLFDFNKLNKEKIFHYSESRGLLRLRLKIAEYYQKLYGASIDPVGEILVTAGSKVIIFMSLQAILNPGDEVLILEPAWLSYQEHARLLDAVPRFIPYDAHISDIGKYISEKTRILVINNPNNPAGRLYSRDELLSIHAQCRQRGVYVLVDEAYSDFVLDESFVSMASIVPDLDGVIVVNSLSKNLGMSGWRIGYAIAKPDFINGLLKLNQHIITCGPTILLHYVAEYLDDILAATLPQVRLVVEKRRRIAARIEQLGLTALPGTSTFYFFLSIEEFPGSSFDFSLYLLLNHGIAVVAGSAYGASTGRFIRLSIGVETEERIFAALDIIAATIALPQIDRADLDRQAQARGLAPYDGGQR